jgi:hypothetical protein
VSEAGGSGQPNERTRFPFQPVPLSVVLRSPDQKADNAILGVRSGDSYADFPSADADIDAPAYSNHGCEVLCDLSFAFDRKASVIPESCLDVANDGNGWPTLNLKVGRKSLFRQHNHSAIRFQWDVRHGGRRSPGNWLKTAGFNKT